MKNKGFTLVELLLVIVIIGIIGAITFTSISEAVSENRTKGGESIEQLLEKNLKLYNIDNEADLWCLEGYNCTPDSGTLYYDIPIKELYLRNPDIDMGECLLADDTNSLLIVKTAEGDYNYYANIVCGTKLQEHSDSDKFPKVVANSEDSSIYYRTSSDDMLDLTSATKKELDTE